MNEVVEVRMASWQAMVQEHNASGLSRNSSILTLFRKMSSSFFAGPDQTNLKGWSGKAMDSALFISA